MYPIGIHYTIAQTVGSLGLLLLMRLTGQGNEIYYQYAMFLTGITGLLTMLPAVFFYRRDHTGRLAGGMIPGRASFLSGGEIVLLLVMGAGLSQYLNILMGILQIFLKSTQYQESMSRITQGQSFWVLLLWMGIVAPIAEEMIFRWLIFLRLRDSMRLVSAALLSGAMFGIYHGNLIQAIYAGILGAVFAYLLEMSGNLWGSILLHMGANIWSLLVSTYGRTIMAKISSQVLLIVYLLLLAGVIAGISYFQQKGKRRKLRMV